MDVSHIVVPSIVGAILTLIIPIITRQTWPRLVRLATAIVITVLVAGAVIVAWLQPSSWQVIAGGLAAAVAVGQVVYQTLKPTGLFSWIEAATTPTQPSITSTTEE